MKKIFIKLILFYRKYLSPIKSTKCPYFPTCSTYGLEAVEKFGAFWGGLLTVWRILRCNPFSKGGYDPVPSIIKIKNKKIKTFYKF
jgi:putative membrane protein insertion efficiency factor